MTWTYCAPQEVLVVFCFNLQAPEEPKCFASEKFYEPNLPKMSEASGHSFQVAVDVETHPLGKNFVTSASLKT